MRKNYILREEKGAYIGRKYLKEKYLLKGVHKEEKIYIQLQGKGVEKGYCRGKLVRTEERGYLKMIERKTMLTL